MTETRDHSADKNESTQDDASHVSSEASSDHSEFSSELIVAMNCIERGDMRSAKAALIKLEEQLINLELTETESAQFEELKRRTRFDPVELWLPVALLVIWAVVFWNTTH